jgi:fructose-1,6-bisphosphatase/inositol monophosphatase family enzyme
VQMLSQAFDDLNRTRLSPETRYSLMEILLPSLEVALSSLSKRFLNQPLIMPEEPRKMAELCDRLFTMAITGYTIVAIEAIQQRETIKETNPARLTCEAIQRALIFAGRKILQTFQLHRPMEPHSWETLHQLYELAEYQWLIDPIDGTKYYAASSSLFSISVGLLRRGDPVAGVVHLAASGQCFHAYEGGGAFLDDRKLEGPRVKRISEAIVNVDTPNSSELSAAERAWFENRLVALQRNVYRVRALGVGSLAACWLASGAFDAYVDLTGYHIPQDLAAGRVLMKEAGARVEFLDSGSGPPKLLATPPVLWEQMHRILKDGI